MSTFSAPSASRSGSPRLEDATVRPAFRRSETAASGDGSLAGAARLGAIGVALLVGTYVVGAVAVAALALGVLFVRWALRRAREGEVAAAAAPASRSLQGSS